MKVEVGKFYTLKPECGILENDFFVPGYKYLCMHISRSHEGYNTITIRDPKRKIHYKLWEDEFLENYSPTKEPNEVLKGIL